MVNLPPPAGLCEIKAGPSLFRSAVSISVSSSTVNVPRPKFAGLESLELAHERFSIVYSIRLFPLIRV